jgi:hypothetical protein
MQACGILIKEEDALVLTMNSIEGDTWFGKKIERNPENVTCDIHKAFIYAKNLGPN